MSTAISETKPQSRGATWGAAAFMALFGGAFTFFGVMALVVGFKGNSAHQEQNAWMRWLLGGLFTLIGIAFDIGVVAVFRVRKYEARMAAKYPGQPWMLNKSWASGRIVDDTGGSMIGAWVFALLWNSISLPTFILALVKQDAGKMIWVIALFPLVGTGMLIAALYLTWRRIKFGRCVLNLETMPGRLGGWMAGTIHIPTTLDTSNGIQIALKCVNKVTTGSGKNTSTYENVLWQDQQNLGGRLTREGAGLALPVAFQIPGTCSASRGGGNNEIIWRVIASAVQPGIDFKSIFAVPVFEVNGPAPAIPAIEAQAAKLRQPAPALPQLAAGAHIEVQKDTARREYFHFPWYRGAKQAISLFIFGIIFAGIGIGIGYADGPQFFSVAFQLVGALILLGASTWLKARTIKVLQDEVELRWSLLGLGGSKSVARSAISRVSYVSTSQVNNTFYYKIVLMTSDGEKVTAATGLKVEDAKWVAAELAGTLGVESAEDAAPMMNMRPS